MKKIETDPDKQHLIHLQVLNLTEEINKLFTGYEMNVILPVLMSSLKRCYDALKNVASENTFWFYMNQGFALGWFGEPQQQEEPPKPKLFLTDKPGDKDGL